MSNQHWVVFYTLYVTGSGFLETVDDYAIHETEAEAVEHYNNVLQLDDLYCAGWGPIQSGTDHWGDPS